MSNFVFEDNEKFFDTLKQIADSAGFPPFAGPVPNFVLPDNMENWKQLSRFIGQLGGMTSLPAKCIFVDATFGNDATGTPYNIAKPFQTIQAAVAAAGAGDTIYVYPGNYDEGVFVVSDLNFHLLNGVTVKWALKTLNGPIKITGDAVIIADINNGLNFNMNTNGGSLFVECKEIRQTADLGIAYASNGNITLVVKEKVLATGRAFVANNISSLNLTVFGDIRHTAANSATLFTASNGGAIYFNVNNIFQTGNSNSIITCFSSGIIAGKAFNIVDESTGGTASITNNNGGKIKISFNEYNTTGMDANKLTFEGLSGTPHFNQFNGNIKGRRIVINRSTKVIFNGDVELTGNTATSVIEVSGNSSTEIRGKVLNRIPDPAASGISKTGDDESELILNGASIVTLNAGENSIVTTPNNKSVKVYQAVATVAPDATTVQLVNTITVDSNVNS